MEYYLFKKNLPNLFLRLLHASLIFVKFRLFKLILVYLKISWKKDISNNEIFILLDFVFQNVEHWLNFVMQLLWKKSNSRYFASYSQIFKVDLDDYGFIILCIFTIIISWFKSDLLKLLFVGYFEHLIVNCELWTY